ncbi:MAG: hypothetical protein ACI38Q_04015 [Candidatus Bruticola sp.]
MKRSTIVYLTLCSTALGFSLISSGCSESENEGNLSFKISNSGSPSEPQIFIPEDTKNIKLEVFREPAVTGQAVSFSSAASAEDSTKRADETDGSPTQSHVEKPLYALGTSSNDKDKNSGKTYYTVSAAYEGGEPELTIEGIADGEWVVRVSALDSNNQVLAYYQDGLTMNGSDRSVKGWLQSGAAPSGYLYAAHTSNGNITRVSLYSNLVDTIKLSSGNPAYLFAKRTETPSFNDIFYATTGGNKILQLTPAFVDKRIDVENLAFPTNGTFVRSSQNSDTAAVSFFQEGMIRFFNFEQDSDYDYVYTGAGAGYISHLTADNHFWVCNEEARNLSLVDMNSHSLVYEDNLRLGNDTPKAAEPSSDNSKIWVIGTRSSGGFVRAVDFSSHDMGGRNWGEFTTDISSPGAICLVSDSLGCVTDNTRGELVFFDAENLDEEGNINEIFGKSGARLRLQGGGDQIISDGARLYILQISQGKICVVDLATKTEASTYNLGSSARSLMHVK